MENFQSPDDQKKVGQALTEANQAVGNEKALESRMQTHLLSSLPPPPLSELRRTRPGEASPPKPWRRRDRGEGRHRSVPFSSERDPKARQHLQRKRHLNSEPGPQYT